LKSVIHHHTGADFSAAARSVVPGVAHGQLETTHSSILAQGDVAGVEVSTSFNPTKEVPSDLLNVGIGHPRTIGLRTHKPP
jgi:hypothetical protein